MPVRSLGSSVLKWPDAAAVDEAVRRWAEETARRRPEALRIGYFGSYARGVWGVGSDVDLVVVVERSDRPFERRAVDWDASALPVPADVLVYTAEEWDRLSGGSKFGNALARETVWVFEKGRSG